MTLHTLGIVYCSITRATRVEGHADFVHQPGFGGLLDVEAWVLQIGSLLGTLNVWGHIFPRDPMTAIHTKIGFCGSRVLCGFGVRGCRAYYLCVLSSVIWEVELQACA